MLYLLISPYLALFLFALKQKYKRPKFEKFPKISYLGYFVKRNLATNIPSKQEHNYEPNGKFIYFNIPRTTTY